jgi:hypothetical protein
METTRSIKGDPMNVTLKDKARKVKEHVVRHRGVYAASLLAITAIALQQSNRKAFERFLIEKGIDPMEYYCPEYFHELNN